MEKKYLLVAEDDAATRLLARRILGGEPYELLEAENGFEALQVAERHEGPIHLLLADMVMPGMSGTELAARLRARRPDLRVLYITGYTADRDVHEELRLAEHEVLAKPFTPDELRRRVAEALQD